MQTVMPTNALREFLRLETAAGLALLLAAVLAMAAQNSPAAWLYDAFIEMPASIAIGPYALSQPLLHWVNDGLMAVFFLLVGLEIKREALEGELKDPAQAVLPVIAALGGMAAPALIFALINTDNPQDLAGWAVPTATDIAFALAALSLAGPRVPPREQRPPDFKDFMLCWNVVAVMTPARGAKYDSIALARIGTHDEGRLYPDPAQPGPHRRVKNSGP